MNPVAFADVLVTASVLANPMPVETYLGQDASAFVPLVNTRSAQSEFLAELSETRTDGLEAFTVDSIRPPTLDFGGSAGLVTTSAIGGVVVADNARNSGSIAATDGSNYLAIADNAGLRIDFDSPVSAFGFTATDLNDAGVELVFGLSGGGTLAVPVGNASASGNALFFGVIAMQSVTFESVRFSVAGNGSMDAFGLDEITVGGPQFVVIPLPTGAGLAGLGLVLVATRRRR